MVRYIVLAIAILLFLGMYFLRAPSQPQSEELEALSVVDSGSEERLGPKRRRQPGLMTSVS